jgi:hypothetical protein
VTSNRDRQAALKARKRKAGLVQVTLWVRPEDKARIKQIAASMQSDEPLQVTQTTVTSNVTSHRPAVTGHRPKTRPRDYPPEVRAMAARMRVDGKTNAQIAAAIQAECGRAPSLKNISRLLSKWVEEVGVSE